MLKRLVKITKKNKRLGRGYAKRGGHTTIRGQKGQKSRGKVKPFNQGGNVPLHRKLPKYPGFKPLRRYIAVRVDLLEKKLENGAIITQQTIIGIGYSKKPGYVFKIVGNTPIKKKFIVKGVKISKGAKEVIEKAGGSVEKI